MSDGSPRPDAPAPAAGVPAPAHRWWHAKALSSEWGLRVLALVLAVLVWSVGRGQITTNDEFPVFVDPVPVSPERFVAFHVGPRGGARITVYLAGPRADVDEARTVLAKDSHVRLYVPDLGAGQDSADVVFTWLNHERRFAFPFPRSLVARVEDVPVKVFRLASQKVRIAVPQFSFPQGHEVRDLKIEPPEFGKEAPVGMFATPLEPDPVDLHPFFQSGRAQQGPISTELSFDRWRNEQDQERFRASIELPKVVLTLRVVPIEMRKIENGFAPVYAGVQDDDLDDYTWEVDRGLPGLALSQMRFTGEFRGGRADLDFLEQRRGEWTYGYRIPLEAMQDFLKKDAKTTTVSAALVWMPTTDALRMLTVQLVPPPAHPEVLVTVTKKER